jgi:hypothetical protein
MKQLELLLQKFNTVSLNEIDAVKLMNRMDRKYWFHISLLEKLLDKIAQEYDVLEINSKRLMEYTSAYFDTEDNFMFLKHHNKKRNRYKVRRRKYLSTNDDFFEIKFKNNKRRTIKHRTRTSFEAAGLLEPEKAFLQEYSPFAGKPLKNSLNNHFYRITLIHKNKLERCTIDLQPKYWNEKGKIGFENLVIFELKRGRSLKSSPMLVLLKQLKIRQRGLSKYCTGRALLDSNLKQNAFKDRLRFIEKNIIN